MKKLITIFLFVLALGLTSKVTAQAFPPSTPASNVQVTYKSSTGTAATISWSRGSGDYCLVVLRKSSSSNVTPPSSTTTNYGSSATYGNGSSLGAGDNYVVYDGTSTAVFVSGLTPNTLYYAYVYEYNDNTIFSTTYYFNTSTSGNNKGFATLEAPPSSCSTITSASSVTGSSATINFSPGGGSGRYILMGPNTLSPTTLPTDGYYYSFSATYGSGAYFGNLYYGMYNNSGTSVAVTGLAGATTYRVYDYEYTNGSWPTWSTFDFNTKNYTSCGSYTFNTTNVPPTINSVSNYTVCQDIATQTVSLSGIGDGSTNENQTISVSATSSNSTLMPNPTVSYISPNTTAVLSYQPNAGQSGTTIITVTVNDNWTVNNITTKTFTITVLPKPGAAGVISGNSPICAGGGLQSYSIAATSNTTSYNWQMPSGFTVTAGGTTNNITVNTTSLTTSGTMTVYAINANGCGNGVANTKTIQVDQQPANPNAGPDAPVVCSNAYFTNATAAVAPDAGVWSWAGGSPTASIGSASSNQTSVNPLNGSPTPTTYTLVWTVTRAGSVCPSKTDNLVITADFNNGACTPASAFSYGPSSDVATNKVCVNSPVNFVDLSVSANTWLWDFEYTGSVGTHTASAQNPTYVYTSTGTYTVFLKIHSNTTGLDYTSTQTLTVIGAPATPGAISGNASGICEGGSSGQQGYSIGAVTNATSYNWTVPPGADTVNFPSAISINVAYGSGAASGNMGVSASNSCGTSGTSTLAVTVSPLPNSAGNMISGPSSVCQGQNNVSFTIAGYTNASSYTWMDLNGVQTTGTGTYTTNIPANAVSGRIYVWGTNACGNGDTLSINVTVNPLPGPAMGTMGTTNITLCPNPGNLQYTTSQIASATSYVWGVPTGASVVAGGNGMDTVMVNYTGAITGGMHYITVHGSNSCGNGSADSVAVMVNTPGAPQICMVTVDSLGTHNIIYWDKSTVAYADSFRIYREDVTNVYHQIGTVQYISLSEFHDFDPLADPNTTTKRYKISSVDSCGNESALSPYHNTIFIQDNGSGQFSWATLYTIEGGPNPVNNYVLMRDDLANGNWNQVAITAGTQQIIVDPTYGSFAMTADWRVETVWNINCTPTNRVINGTQSTVVKSKSNITNNRTTGVKQNRTADPSVYPNPTNGNLNISFANGSSKAYVKLVSMLGQEIYNAEVTGNDMHIIDMSKFENGAYMLQITNNNTTINQRIIKN